jgi:hypothetical protein
MVNRYEEDYGKSRANVRGYLIKFVYFLLGASSFCQISILSNNKNI